MTQEFTDAVSGSGSGNEVSQASWLSSLSINPEWFILVIAAWGAARRFFVPARRTDFDAAFGTYIEEIFIERRAIAITHFREAGPGLYYEGSVFDLHGNEIYKFKSVGVGRIDVRRSLWTYDYEAVLPDGSQRVSMQGALRFATPPFGRRIAIKSAAFRGFPVLPLDPIPAEPGPWPVNWIWRKKAVENADYHFDTGIAAKLINVRRCIRLETFLESQGLKLPAEADPNAEREVVKKIISIMARTRGRR